MAKDHKNQYRMGRGLKNPSNKEIKRVRRKRRAKRPQEERTARSAGLFAALLAAVAGVFLSPETLDESRYDPKFFTRNRILTFPVLCVMLLCSDAGTLASAAKKFLVDCLGRKVSVSKQAVSQARKKISAVPFIKANFELVKAWLSDRSLRTVHGYVPIGIDGSTLKFPKGRERDVKELKDYFGGQDGRTMARLSTAYLLEEEIILDTLCVPYKAAERDMLRAHLEKLGWLAEKQKLLLVCDAGYPEERLFGEIDAQGHKFLMRCSQSFLKPVNGAPLGLSTVALGSGLKVRILKFLKDPDKNGERETVTLITNATGLSAREMRLLYRMRWAVENGYDDLKHRAGMVSWKSLGVNGVLQEVHAAVLRKNINSLACLLGDEILEERRVEAREEKARWREQNPEEAQLEVSRSTRKKRERNRWRKRCDRNQGYACMVQLRNAFALFAKGEEEAMEREARIYLSHCVKNTHTANRTRTDANSPGNRGKKKPEVHINRKRVL